MLVTVSGLVGSGKTTVARHLVRFLKSEQDTAALWNFRNLPCFHPLGGPRRDSTQGRRPSERGNGYRLKPLTAGATLGYVVRIVAFRFYMLRHRSTTHKVTNRYFYDNLAHFALEGALERIYFSLLASLIPRPDVAILAMASIDTTASRRPLYSAEYIMALHASYSTLSKKFPNLVVVSTDPGQPSLERVQEVMSQAIGG